MGMVTDNHQSIWKIYQKLYFTFGSQHWWPAETPLEVMLGAILTQNTAWKNVEKAISALKTKGLLNLNQLIRVSPQQLAQLIKPTGYYRIKTQRLLALIRWLHEKGGIEKIKYIPTPTLRAALLKCYGVGPETADSILLYALGRPVFVIDSYTRRILSRYGIIQGDEPYEILKEWIEKSIRLVIGDNTRQLVSVFNEFHALLVQLGKKYCRPHPQCYGCPLAAD